MKYTILILAMLPTATGEVALSLRLEENNSVAFRDKDGQKITVCVGKLFYKEEGDALVAANESYVVELIGDGYPRIIDVLDGHSVKFQLADVDEKKGDEVLAFYFSGGNQYGVKLYGVQDVEIKPFKTQPPSSNMRSVKLIGKDIIVNNEARNAEGIRFISKEIYNVISGDCKLVRKERSRPQEKEKGGSQEMRQPTARQMAPVLENRSDAASRHLIAPESNADLHKFPITDSDKAFFEQIRKAILAEDIEWFSEALSYPIVLRLSKGEIKSKNKKDLTEHATLIFNTHLKSTVRNQASNSLLKNWQGVMIGVMIGNGEIWFSEVGEKTEKGNVWVYRIIGINLPKGQPKKTEKGAQPKDSTPGRPKSD